MECPEWLKNYDEVFAYRTPKIVILKDRRIGIFSTGLKLVLLSYIVGYKICFKGSHLIELPVDGVSSLTVWHPTKNMCDLKQVGCAANFSRYTELPYCLQSKMKTRGQKRNCSTWDWVEVAGSTKNGVLLATRVQRFDQVRSDLPSVENGWELEGQPFVYVFANKTNQTMPGNAVPRIDKYVADIERYVLFIKHSCGRDDGFQADGHDMRGYYNECPSNQSKTSECRVRAIRCVYDWCRGRRHVRHAPKATDGNAEKHLETFRLLQGGEVVETKMGDTFTVSSLLRLANVDLDKDNQREQGRNIFVRIHYDNRRPGSFHGLKALPGRAPDLFYTYTVSVRGSEGAQHVRTKDDPDAQRRIIRNYIGIQVVIQQSGSVAVWDTYHFLIIVTTSLGLLWAANFFMDLLLTYVFPRKEEYARHKYHHSHRMNSEDEDTLIERLPTGSHSRGDGLIRALELRDGHMVAKRIRDLVDPCWEEKV